MATAQQTTQQTTKPKIDPSIPDDSQAQENSQAQQQASQNVADTFNGVSQQLADMMRTMSQSKKDELLNQVSEGLAQQDILGRNILNYHGANTSFLAACDLATKLGFPQLIGKYIMPFPQQQGNTLNIGTAADKDLKEQQAAQEKVQEKQQEAVQEKVQDKKIANVIKKVDRVKQALVYSAIAIAAAAGGKILSTGNSGLPTGQNQSSQNNNRDVAPEFPVQDTGPKADLDIEVE